MKQIYAINMQNQFAHIINVVCLFFQYIYV